MPQDVDQLELMFSEAEIQARVREMAPEVKSRIDGHDVMVFGLLRGAVFFLVDLIRAIGEPNLELELVQVSSYVGQKSTGNLEIYGRLPDVRGKTVLLVDDIVDTGLTLYSLQGKLRALGADEVVTAVFLDKAERREVDFVPDFTGFVIPDKFVVGYGMDCNGGWRCLRDIRVIPPEE